MKVDTIYRSIGHSFKGRHGLGSLDYEMEQCDSVELIAGSGIVGDRYFDYKEDFKGQITFFHSAVYEEVKRRFDLPELKSSAFRRNVLVSDVDLNELIGKTFRIGSLEFSGSEEAAPCYWMDEACAPGVFEFLKGNGGLRCRILNGGTLDLSQN